MINGLHDILFNTINVSKYFKLFGKKYFRSDCDDRAVAVGETLLLLLWSLNISWNKSLCMNKHNALFLHEEIRLILSMI